MIHQPHAPQIASKSTLATSSARAVIATALRDAVDPGTAIQYPDGGPITVTLYGRTVQITALDITDQR